MLACGLVLSVSDMHAAVVKLLTHSLINVLNNGIIKSFDKHVGEGSFRTEQLKTCYYYVLARVQMRSFVGSYLNYEHIKIHTSIFVLLANK